MSVYQTNVIEFTVTSRLGGTTRNRLFSIDDGDPDYVAPDDQNIRSFTMEELGVVDLSLVPGAPSIGMRFVPWIWLSVPVAAAPGLCQVVDSESFKIMRQVFGTATTGTYFNLGVAVPQGGALKFTEWTVPAGAAPIRLRISVAPAKNVLHWAMMRKAFCCLGSSSPLFVPAE